MSKIPHTLRQLANRALEPFLRARPFSYEQFVSDCEEAFPRYTKASALVNSGIDIKVFIREGNDGIADVTPLIDCKQYIINFYKEGFFRLCFDALVIPVTRYYRRHESELDVDVDLFLRMTLTVAALMAFWHEVAHIVRGTLVYEAKVGRVLEVDWTKDPATVLDWIDTNKYPVLPRRLLELDADIFGAQFTLAHVVISAKSDGRIRPTTFWQCFGLGIRGLFDALCKDGPHDASIGTVHPHALNRAYVAISHSLARLDSMKVSNAYAQEAIAAATQVLLEYQLYETGHRVDPRQLEIFCQSELEVWRQRSNELLPFQILKAGKNR